MAAALRARQGEAGTEVRADMLRARRSRSVLKCWNTLNYGRRGYCLYLLVQEAASEGGELFRVCAAHKSGSAFVIYVAWAAEAVPAREDAANLQGGLACGGDQTHLRTQDAVDRRGDERVVGAPEHDRIDPALHNRLEIATRDSFELGPVYDATFDHGHELGAGLLVDLDSCVQGVDGSPVRPASRGQRRRENSDAPVAGLLYRGPRPGLDDPYDRHLERTLCRPQRRSRRCVARDHDQLHVHADEVVYDLEREPTDLGKVTYPVRNPRGVPKIYGVLVRQTVLDLRKHRQPTHTRIEDANGPRITHGALLCQHFSVSARYARRASLVSTAPCRRLVSTLRALRPSLSAFQLIQIRPRPAAHERLMLMAVGGRYFGAASGCHADMLREADRRRRAD